MREVRCAMCDARGGKQLMSIATMLLGLFLSLAAVQTGKPEATSLLGKPLYPAPISAEARKLTWLVMSGKMTFTLGVLVGAGSAANAGAMKSSASKLRTKLMSER